jgi:hypothetical protein
MHRVYSLVGPLLYLWFLSIGPMLPFLMAARAVLHRINRNAKSINRAAIAASSHRGKSLAQKIGNLPARNVSRPYQARRVRRCMAYGRARRADKSADLAGCEIARRQLESAQ